MIVLLDCFDFMRGDAMFRAEVVFDQTTKPEDFECYSSEEIERWANDEWRFVGVRVFPLSNDQDEVRSKEESLWGIATGLGDHTNEDDTYLREVAEDLAFAIITTEEDDHIARAQACMV